MKSRLILRNAFQVLFASVLYALAVSLFLSPHAIVTGGATGIAVTVYTLTGFPVGLLVIMINSPLLLLCAYFTGIKSTSKTVLAILLTSVCTDILSFLPPLTDDRFLAALSGSILLGTAIGILLVRGYTTGGTELAAYLLNKQYRRIPVGRFVIVIDATIVCISAIVFRQFDTLLYSAASVFFFSTTLDLFLKYSVRGKMLTVITSEPEKISDLLRNKTNRGATLLRGSGMFSGADRTVILCALGRSELFLIRDAIREIDPSAFTVVNDTTEVIGNGFSSATH